MCRPFWTTLHKLEDDDSLRVEPFSVASWNIEPTKESLKAYRFFRIRSTGPNTSGGDNLRLACAGIELYGTLTEENTELRARLASIERHLNDFMATSYSNVHRGVHALSQEATDAFEAARAKIAAFMNAEERETVHPVASQRIPEW